MKYRVLTLLLAGLASLSLLAALFSLWGYVDNETALSEVLLYSSLSIALFGIAFLVHRKSTP